MRTIQSSLQLEAHQKAAVATLQDDKTPVFLDTNVLLWAFRLNDAAYAEFTRWLAQLAHEGRLAIPAWVVHEYNHQLLRNDPAVFHPHKGLGHQLKSNLEELTRVAHLMVSEQAAVEMGHVSRDTFLAELGSATTTIQECASRLAKFDVSRQHRRALDLERLIAQAGLTSSIHELADKAAREAAARYANRLSPGYQDSGKPENPSGDFIIWKEVLTTCVSRKARSAVLITNDRKADWVYTPLAVVLPNGKTLHGSNELLGFVKLPKPDLLVEFEHHTGGSQLSILSIEAVVDVLSSLRLNPIDALDFRNLALAIRVDLARTPTEAVVHWFLSNPDTYRAAIDTVCYWSYSPEEVDREAFRIWTIEKMKLTADKAEKVAWDSVFLSLFI